MPIGIVSDHDLARELNSLAGKSKKESHTPTPEIVDIERPGRSEGDNNVPDSLRKIIGEEAVLNGRQSALSLASMFDVSPSSVSAYANGATSTTTYDNPSKSIISHINKSRVRATKKAAKVLSGALEAITQEKLDYADAKDLAVIAKNMSGIIKDLEPPSEANVSETKTPNFIIYAPQFRQENSFETIEVKE